MNGARGRRASRLAGRGGPQTGWHGTQAPGTDTRMPQLPVITARSGEFQQITRGMRNIRQKNSGASTHDAAHKMHPLGMQAALAK